MVLNMYFKGLFHTLDSRQSLGFDQKKIDIDEHFKVDAPCIKAALVHYIEPWPYPIPIRIK